MSPPAERSNTTRYYVQIASIFLCLLQALFVPLTWLDSVPTSAGMAPESIYAQIGVFIRTRRKQLKLRQEDLALRVGLSRASLANIETGRQNLLVHHLYALAQALQLKPIDLLPPTDFALPNETLPLPPGLNPEERKGVSRMFAILPKNVSKITEKDTHHGKKKRRSN